MLWHPTSSFHAYYPFTETHSWSIKLPPSFLSFTVVICIKYRNIDWQGFLQEFEGTIPLSGFLLWLSIFFSLQIILLFLIFSLFFFSFNLLDLYVDICLCSNSLCFLNSENSHWILPVSHHLYSFLLELSVYSVLHIIYSS